MKYRIYRKRVCVEYKDVEADSYDEARGEVGAPREGFIVTDDGYITDSVVTRNRAKEYGASVFLDEIRRTMEDKEVEK